MSSDPTENHVRNYHKRLRFGALLLTVALLAFWVGINVGFTNSRSVESIAILSDRAALPPTDVDLAPLWRAWNTLESKFVPTATSSSPSKEDLVWGAIGGVAKAYGDPYTVFFPPAQSSIFEEDINGSFGGVGIEIGIRDNILTVIAPLKDTPADIAGVKSGDRIAEIDGNTTEGMPIDEAVGLIRGKVGAVVTLTIVREGESELKKIPIKRGVINIPTIDTKTKDGVFIISLYNFSAQSPNLFREALRKFIESDSNNLVLDLRNNPGGFLEAAIDTASWFLPAGKVVVIEDLGNKDAPRVHRSKGYNIFSDGLNMVVLVNEGSASASEILAGALSENGVAKLVGTRTFGKGSVQEVVKITSDTSLKVTIARWLTPNGNSISKNGLTPDVEVKMDEKDVLKGRDTQLERAIEVVKER